MTIYELLTVLAVLTNAGLLVYTIDVMPSYSPSDHVWAFITFQFVCYSSLYTAHLFIPDTPKDVIIQLQRGDILVERIIQNVPEKGRTSNDILAEMRRDGILTGKINKVDSDEESEEDESTGGFFSTSLFGGGEGTGGRTEIGKKFTGAPQAFKGSISYRKAAFVGSPESRFSTLSHSKQNSTKHHVWQSQV